MVHMYLTSIKDHFLCPETGAARNLTYSKGTQPVLSESNEVFFNFGTQSVRPEDPGENISSYFVLMFMSVLF